MPQIPTSHVTTTLQLLGQAAAERTAANNETSENISNTDSDDDYVSGCPVYESFYKQGASASIIQLISFDAKEFHIM